MVEIKENIGVRLNKYQREHIRKALNKGLFSTVSDFVTAAIDRFIQDLEAERIEIRDSLGEAEHGS